MEYVADVEEYAARRKPEVQRLEDSLVRSVKAALRRHPSKTWSDSLFRRAETEVRRIYRQQTGKPSARGAGLVRYLKDMRSSLERMLDVEPAPERLDEQARNIAASAAALILSTATLAAARDSGEDGLEKVWIDMDDKKVRAAHRKVEAVPLGKKFDVDGVAMDRPGDTSAPVALWINCRCIVGVRSSNAAVAASLVASPTKEETMTDVLDLAAEVQDAEVVDLTDTDDDISVPWHGVLAPEGVWSGDRRRFAPDSLSNRDLPLPLSWQKVNADGHDGSVVIGSIDRIWKDEAGLMWGEGMMLDTPEAGEYVNLNATGASRGISVDVDQATMQIIDMEGNVLEGEDMFSDEAGMEVTAGRVSGATACAIPAFQEAFIRLGRYEDAQDEALVASADCLPCQYQAGIDEGAWPIARESYTDEQWAEACIADDVPIYTPEGRLSRAGVLAASTDQRVLDNPVARDLISGALSILGEPVLDTTFLDADEFAGEFVKTEDGPGWLTHPVDTQRLRHYWTKGKGALKIRWGVPGDFNRCKQQLAKYIKPQYLSGYCANRHYDALGFWPGRPVAGDVTDFSGPSMRFITASGLPKPPREWFENPRLTGASHVVVTEEGRVLGHIAAWGECHISFGEMAGQCILAPHSMTNYAHFATGAVLTDDGQVATGPLTMETGHEEDGYASAAVAAAHYDNTGTAVADVAVGEDQYGIWCAGMVRPGTSPERIHALRASDLSGDWRTVRGNLELVAALVCNVGGFSTPRVALAASGGRQLSLVAAGIITRSYEVGPDDERFDLEKFAAAVAISLRGIDDRRGRMAALKKKTGRDPATKMAALAANRKG